MSPKTKRNDPQPAKPLSWRGPPIALFWDQSLLWGLICVETLDRLGIPFHLLSAREITEGSLDAYRVLLVPGGWAAHKLRALGEAGAHRVRAFVESGGSYLGFCGGAGLALSSAPALGLVPLERMELSERLPSASGGVWIEGVPGHPAWEGLPERFPVSVWWPSQFSWQPLPRALPLAVYKAPGPDFCVADLPAADLEACGMRWEDWEKVYGINLDPARLLGHPAIMELRCGKGRLILSYPHLETPGSTPGNRLFSNLLAYLDALASPAFPRNATPPSLPGSFDRPPGLETLHAFEQMEEAAQNLIRFGERHLLWNWRTPWLLHWRRGLRGLEYSTLAVAAEALVKVVRKIARESETVDPWLEPARRLDEEVQTFCRLAARLLLEEKLAIQAGNLTKLGTVNETVDRLRGELFGTKMNHGGRCRALFDTLDRLLLAVYRLGAPSSHDC